MCFIFILAGAFAKTANEMGAVKATVNIAMTFIPSHLLIIGLFFVSCFISISIGTSVGTIAALTPIAMGFVMEAHLSGALCLGSVIGGAMFGDNLSMISDTTIAATRTQKVGMDQKFKENIYVVIPAVVLTTIAYLFFNQQISIEQKTTIAAVDWVKLIPYIVVLILAISGKNVMAVLMIGTLIAGIIGMVYHVFDFSGFLSAMGAGALSMSETLIVALVSGGLLRIVRYNGGIEYLLEKIEKHIHGTKGGEMGIAALLAAVNIFTANNTVAIVIVGPVAHDISKKYHIRPSRTASILDTTSCIVQGMLPYGAQVLVAIGLATQMNYKISAMTVISYLWYPYFLALIMILSISFGYPKRLNKSKVKTAEEQ